MKKKLAEFEIECKQLKTDKIILEEKVDYLTRKLYGTKSEKISKEETPDLFNEAEMGLEEAKTKSEPETVEIKYTRKKGKTGRKSISDKLPRVEIIHDIPEEEKICACGCQMSKIGEEVSEKLKIIPMQIEVEKHVRPKYVCKKCDGIESEGVHPTVKIAEVPPTILPKTIATPSLLTYILINKFSDGLPFYRQEKIFLRLDIDIKRANMCNWTVKAYENTKVLENLLIRELKNSFLVGIDETTVQVLNEPGKSPQSKSYMWVFRGGTKENPIILFHYDPGRSGDVPFQYLENYKGYIQTDGYEGYNKLASVPDIVQAGCWAHVRRKFFDVIEPLKKQKYDKSESLAHEIMDLITILYDNERLARENNFTREELTNYRQEKSKPILDEIKNLLEINQDKVLPQSKLGIAVRYTLSRLDKLIKYIDDGLIPIDNNLVENAIRPFVIGRKNWLFYDSQDGARASAFFYSLIETAKANKLEPYSYLNYVFEQIPLCKTESDYEKLLP
ncbi:MAG TPA: IS66 family transposase, partial [Spirochaetota bacterium]|nr:IS66 family transposase [Spirochaetota bacterium]